MKISAVIPAYNSAKFISAAVASIQAQTEPVAEIVIVDDGSTDETEAIVRALPGNIIYYKQKNQGPSAARNKGIELASGDWIAFLDADDQWVPNKIALQKQILIANPELKLVAGDMAEIDIDDNITVKSVLAKHQLFDYFHHLAGCPIPNALAKLVEKNFIPTGTVLIDRETIISSGRFNQEIRFGEDLEMWAKIAAVHAISCVPEVLMLRRQHGNNATQANRPMLADLIKVMNSIREFAGPQLSAQGIDANLMVANAYWSLGYWSFINFEHDQARVNFLISMKQKFTLRSLKYLTLSNLPKDLIIKLRSLKQVLN
ncbi:glycosyltransferase family 2 protein [Methylomonas koyamae]|uniref:glycosyltransferase family 2 protein n=1 Tax=Methylomonas koyamae TaxID=702114 RepID=UPI00112BA9DB|nr:glycosyltransferase [Methylomonas koyamae]TPQ28638.1 hypothetical protein C2U68_04035 [Methylomonas koyamae]